MSDEERIELADLLFPNLEHDRDYYENLYPNRKLLDGAMVTRFGPSPTGFVHMGSLFGAFIDRTFATQSGGIFYLRIEDTDQKRTVENGIDGIFNDLDSFDIIPDESTKVGGEYGPYIQSQRVAIYQTYIKDLIIKGKAYPCFMTEKDLEQIREEQEINKVRTGVYGIYAADRDLSLAEIKEKINNGEKYVIRLKSPGDYNNKIEFVDLIKGKMRFPESDEDFVLLKKDGIPTYHFAHAIDDHLMHTTHVIRADEWVSSIPKHVQLFNVLGFKIPEFCHHAPLTKKDEKTGAIRKLSKRKDPEAAVSFYDEMGIPNDAIKLYLATILNSNFEEWYLKNPDKSYQDFNFTFDKMAVGGTSFDLDKLMNISKTYFAHKSGIEVYEETLNWALKYDSLYAEDLLANKDDMIKYLSIEKDGPRPRKDISKYSDVKEEFSYAIDSMFIDENYSKYDGDKIYDVDLILNYVNDYLDLNVDNSEWFDNVREFASSNGYAVSPKEYKLQPNSYKGHVGDICEALRVMITGRLKSPDLFSIMKILGKDRIISRIELYNNYK